MQIARGNGSQAQPRLRGILDVRADMGEVYEGHILMPQGSAMGPHGHRMLVH